MLAILGLFLVTATNRGAAQDVNASLSGTVTDSSGAAIPGAKLSITNEATGFQAAFVSDAAGSYSFRNLTPGKYTLVVSMTGFKAETQKGIELGVNQTAHTDIHLAVGQMSETVTVTADTSLINYENQTLEGGVSPEVLQDFPLVVGGAPRSSVAVATMMPGVTSAGGNNAFNARINGGLVTGDEAIVDGVTVSEGYMNQSGMVALQTDFGMSPDITSEVHVLTANYDAQYGNSTSGQLIIQTKSGGEQFHGGGYDYIRNDFMNAIQYGNSKRPPDKENDFGAFVGGPWYVPGFHGPNSFLKGYFYFNWEGFQDHGGAVSANDSIASTNARAGNFSGWGSQLWYPNDPTKYGALAGTKIVGNIIPSQYEDPIAKAWLGALPTPTASTEQNNYYVPVSGQGSLTNSENVYFARADLDIGQRDHLYYTYWWQYSGLNLQSDLPIALSNAGPANPENAPIQRFNWEHTFSNVLTNHLSLGYLNRNEGYTQLDGKSTLPKVSGTAGTADMPEMSISGYTTLGSNSPASSAFDVTTRGTYGLTDSVTFVHGRHTFNAGYEWTKAGTSIHNGTNKGGTFTFNPNTTGNSVTGDTGDGMAAFYLGAVANATTNYYNIPAEYPRQYTNTVHFGDSWHVAPRLTASLGMRWDYVTPFSEKYNNLTFFDPNGTNPNAIYTNPVTLQQTPLKGRLAYAGSGFGSASYGAAYPEVPFKAGWAPRVGFAYTLDSKTVVRAGYGIYYGRAFYPGWNGGMSQDGFNKSVNLNQTASGAFEIPVLYLANGISAAQTGSTKSVINSGFDNGGSTPNYRPLDGNKRPYSQQWNLTVERQLPSNFFVSVSYVGTKGTHLPSSLSPINILNPGNPTVQAIGSDLGVSYNAPPVAATLTTPAFIGGPATFAKYGITAPYSGWAAQMTSCAPTIAQALVPYPMYCGTMQGQNEQHGTSIYNSFQAKIERHMTHGLYLLGVLTTSKMYTDASDTVQSGNDSGAGNQGNNGQFSPYQLKPRAWAIVPDNVPVTGQISAIYTLPFGKNEKWANDNAVADEIIGGWRVTPLFHYDYGTPFSFYSSNCATSFYAGQLRQGCVPGILPGQTVQPHGRNGYNPKSGVPYLNINALEGGTATALSTPSPFNAFGFTGTGGAVTSVYGPSYKNVDISLAKDFAILERVKFKFSANFFNAFNNHYLIASQGGNYGGPSVAFHNDVANSNFGTWTGSVSTPRTIQFSGRLEF
jgi:hypothetical protein